MRDEPFIPHASKRVSYQAMRPAKRPDFHVLVATRGNQGRNNSGAGQVARPHAGAARYSP